MKPSTVERSYVISLAELKAAFKIEGKTIDNAELLDDETVRIATVEKGE